MIRAPEGATPDGARGLAAREGAAATPGAGAPGRRPRPSSLPRPRRPVLPLLAGAGLLGLWTVVAHDSGLGWVQTVGALVAGVLVVGLVAPAVAVVRIAVAVAASPPDARRGSPTRLHVTVSAPAEVRAIDPPGPAVLTGDAARVVLECTPGERGLVDRVTVSVASAAPFGLLWWSRTVVLPLERPIAVAPRVGPRADPALVRRTPAVIGLGADRDATRAAPGVVASGPDPRGVRPYDHGDPRHLVHWPATAHAGVLMMRENERPARAPAVVDGVLPDDPEDPEGAERRAEAVMATVTALLASGATVHLGTLEPSGPLTAPVASAAEAGRRLATALPRPARPGATGARDAGAADVR